LQAARKKPRLMVKSVFFIAIVFVKNQKRLF
jgi:hypothetical protein